MTKKRIMLIVVVFVGILGVSSTLISQVNSSSQLYKTLKEKDQQLFEAAFSCDVAQVDQMIHEDFEFYHDISGITKSKEAFVSQLKTGICQSDKTTRRELVDGSLEVFPLENDGELYGAIQTGKHRFYIKEKGEKEELGSVAKFTHVWLLNNSEWKVARVLSYDHR